MMKTFGALLITAFIHVASSGCVSREPIDTAATAPAVQGTKLQSTLHQDLTLEKRATDLLNAHGQTPLDDKCYSGGDCVLCNSDGPDPITSVCCEQADGSLYCCAEGNVDGDEICFGDGGGGASN